MMGKKIVLLFLVFFVFAVSCDKNRNEFGVVGNQLVDKFDSRYSIDSLVFKEFILDSVTINTLGYIQFVELGGNKSTLTFLNQYDNSIYFYDYESTGFIEKKIFDKDKVFTIQGYDYIDNDSIFLYNYGKSRLYLVDNNADILFNASMYTSALAETRDVIYPAPYCHTPSPLRYYNGKILSAGFVAGEPELELRTPRLVMTCLDLQTKDLSHFLNYPEQYAKYNWAGGLTYRMPYYELVDNSIIVSFSAHHNLVKYNLQTGEQEEFYAGSSSITEITSFPHNKSAQSLSSDEWEWYMTTPSYEGVFYDKYRDVYYRVARLPIEEYAEDARYNNKPVIVIVLDSDLNYLGEYPPIDGDVILNPFNSFVAPDGFNIQVMTENEDKLTYVQYKVGTL